MLVYRVFQQKLEFTGSYVVSQYCTICLRNQNIMDRPVPFDDFMVFVVLSLFTGGSPKALGGTCREMREDNKSHKIIKWGRPDYGNINENIMNKSTY